MSWVASGRPECERVKPVWKDSMVTRNEDSALPGGLAAPARRALAAAGVRRLEDLTRFREAEILALHGMGPKAFEQLRTALGERGLAFAGSERP
jgi:hypothetical protein